MLADSNEIRTCYDCGKRITEEDEFYYQDADLCKQCYYMKDDDDKKEEE